MKWWETKAASIQWCTIKRPDYKRSTNEVIPLISSAKKKQWCEEVSTQAYRSSAPLPLAYLFCSRPISTQHPKFGNPFSRAENASQKSLQRGLLWLAKRSMNQNFFVLSVAHWFWSTHVCYLLVFTSLYSHLQTMTLSAWQGKSGARAKGRWRRARPEGREKKPVVRSSPSLYFSSAWSTTWIYIQTYVIKSHSRSSIRAY